MGKKRSVTHKFSDMKNTDIYGLFEPENGYNSSVCVDCLAL